MPVQDIAAFANTKRLIVIAAHPDDLETLCGGTLFQLAQLGVQIFSVNCTLGDIGSSHPTDKRAALAQMRLVETVTAAHILGLTGVYTLGYPDGELEPTLALRAAIARLYRLTQADTLLTFDPYWTGQVHPDHRAAGQAALDAYMPSKMPLYHPEHLSERGAGPAQLERIFLFHTDRDPDLFIDVSHVYEIKQAACRAHVSQFPEGDKSLEWMRRIDGAAGKQIGAAYAEKFRRLEVW